jgi:hypothetical protein
VRHKTFLLYRFLISFAVLDGFILGEFDREPGRSSKVTCFFFVTSFTSQSVSEALSGFLVDSIYQMFSIREENCWVKIENIDLSAFRVQVY